MLPLLAALPDKLRMGTAGERSGCLALPARAAAAACKLRAGPQRRVLLQEPHAGTGAAEAGAGRTECPSTRRCSAPQCGFAWSISSVIPKPRPTVKTAFANLNTSALRILMEEAGNPKFMSRHLGVAGGAVSQDQDYLDRHTARIERSRSRWKIPSCSIRCWQACSTQTPTCAPRRWIRCAR